jgi:periplasmic divalent cation tolerance protein
LTAAAILILTTLPDRASAEAIASALVRERLAACVGIGAATRSIYHWRGKVETADEVTLTVKTRRERYAAVEAALRAAHPYELPEIIAVPVIDGFTPYLDWIAAETAPPG